jgi:hypothetical protein
VEGLAERGERGRGQAGGLEAGEELGGLGGEVGVGVVGHGGEEARRVRAELVGVLGQVQGRDEAGLVPERVVGEEDGVGELGRQQDLPQPRQDLVQAQIPVGFGDGRLRARGGVGLVGELGGLEPEPRRREEELVFRRGQAPARKKKIRQE